VKAVYITRHDGLSREQLDAHGTLLERMDFRQCVIGKFNDITWVPVTEVLPQLHSDFLVPIECPLTVEPMDVDQVKDRIMTVRGLLHLMVTQWERSGNGRFMLLPPTHPEHQSEEYVYDFFDGDDRQNFLRFANNRTYVLYFWHIAHEHQILQSACEGFKHSIAGNGSHVPCARDDISEISGNSRLSLFQRSQLQEMQELSRSVITISSGMDLSNQINSLTDMMTKLQDSIFSMQKSIDTCEEKILEAEESNAMKLVAARKKVKARMESERDEVKCKLQVVEDQLSFYTRKQEERILSQSDSASKKRDITKQRAIYLLPVTVFLDNYFVK